MYKKVERVSLLSLLFSGVEALHEEETALIIKESALSASVYDESF